MGIISPAGLSAMMEETSLMEQPKTTLYQTFLPYKYKKKIQIISLSNYIYMSFTLFEKWSSNAKQRGVSYVSIVILQFGMNLEW